MKTDGRNNFLAILSEPLRTKEFHLSIGTVENPFSIICIELPMHFGTCYRTTRALVNTYGLGSGLTESRARKINRSPLASRLPTTTPNSLNAFVLKRRECQDIGDVR